MKPVPNKCASHKRLKSVTRRLPFLSVSAIVLSIFAPLCNAANDTLEHDNSTIPQTSKATLPNNPATESASELFLQGVAFEEGSVVPKDEGKAALFYRRAAEQDYAPAEYNLALLYEEGRGVTQNLTEAGKWYRAAAEQGDAEAQNNLGRLYSLGHGVPLSAQQAAFWYEKAAEQGSAEGQSNLGNSYREGRGVTQDFKKALELYQAAAMKGYAIGQNNLALMYANGKGTERNYALAYAWLTLAASELPGSQSVLEQIKGKMTLGEIREGRRRAEELGAQLTLKNDGLAEK